MKESMRNMVQTANAHVEAPLDSVLNSALVLSLVPFPHHSGSILRGQPYKMLSTWKTTIDTYLEETTKINASMSSFRLKNIC